MLTEKEWRGEWWLPNVPNSSFAGTLKYSPEKGLELSSKYPIPDFFDKGKKDYYEIILGRTEKGKSITLSGCAFFNNIFAGQFFPKYAIEGALFSSEEQVLLHCVSISFNSLTNWARITGFKREPTERGTKLIIHKRPKGKTIGNVGDIKFVLRTYVTHSMKRSHTHDESIKEETFVCLESSHKIHIEKYFDAFFVVRNFLSLAMGHPTHPRKITGFIGKYSKHHTNKKFINIFLSLAVLPKEEEALIPPRILFPFQLIKNQSNTIISKWIKMHTKYKNIIGLYYGVISTDKMHTNEELLYYIKMLEGFYSIKYASPKHNLKRKMSTLLKDNKDNVTKMGSNPGTFIDLSKLINTRDYYTHYNPQLERYLLKGTELYQTIARLRTLFEMCIWKELGMKSQDVASAYNRAPNRSRMMGLNIEQP